MVLAALVAEIPWVLKFTLLYYACVLVLTAPSDLLLRHEQTRLNVPTIPLVQRIQSTGASQGLKNMAKHLLTNNTKGK